MRNKCIHTVYSGKPATKFVATETTVQRQIWSETLHKSPTVTSRAVCITTSKLSFQTNCTQCQVGMHNDVTHSLFNDSSVDNVSLQANPDVTSLFLNTPAAQTCYYKTVKLCNLNIDPNSWKIFQNSAIFMAGSTRPVNGCYVNRSD